MIYDINDDKIIDSFTIENKNWSISTKMRFVGNSYDTILFESPNNNYLIWNIKTKSKISSEHINN